MNVLIVHQNFPGQFPHIADALVARGDKVAAIGGGMAQGRPGIDLRKWENKRSTTPKVFARAVRVEADLIRAEAAAKQALALRNDGFTPDVIVGHPGWGETIHLKEIWPHAKLILFGEQFYSSRNGEIGFDHEFDETDLGLALTVNAKAAAQSLACVLADRIISPTEFQASSFPPGLQSQIRVIHEGLDLSLAQRRAGVSVKVPGKADILDGDRPLVTLVNRTLEPLRGFHIFVRALPAFFDACPDAHAAIVGQALPMGYGGASPVGECWLDWAKADLGDRLDWSRVHLLDVLPHDTLMDLFSISWAHVYYTYPFVLSWSLVEAMACECLILASDTPPLHDAIINGYDGLLMPFFDIDALSTAMIRAVREPEAFSAMRMAARRTALDRFDSRAGVAGWLAAIDELAAR